MKTTCPWSPQVHFTCDKDDCAGCLQLTMAEEKRNDEGLCIFCGTDLEVEREMFSRDNLFTGHSCRGSELLKRAR